MSTSLDQNHVSQAVADKVFVIFVGDIEEKWHEGNVIAERIMREAGVSEPEKFILEALERKVGNPVTEFTSTQPVDLEAKDRKFFRITPGGGGRS